MRAEVIKKQSHPERYGHVATVIRTSKSPTYTKVWLKFDDGVIHTFDEEELRMGVKASAE